MQPPVLRLMTRLSFLAVLVFNAFPCEAAGNAIQWLQGGHAGTVNAVAFSGDGTLIASASEDATIKLWATNGTLVRTLSTHPYQVSALAFSPDGARLSAGLYSGGYKKVSGTPIGGLGRVLTWEATGTWADGDIALVRTATNHLSKITCLAYSPDGLRLASSGAEGSNVVCAADTGAQLARRAAFNVAEGPSIAWGVALAANGLWASACEDGTLRVWDDSGNEVWSTNSPHNGDVTAVAFSPDGTRLASAGTDTSVRIWSTGDWSCLHVLTNHLDDVLALAFSPDGGMLVSGSLDQTLKLWDVASGACLATALGHVGGVVAVDFSPEGSTFVSGGMDHSVRQWSASDGALFRNFTAHQDMVKSVLISPDGRLCATISNDESIQIRRLADGHLVCRLTGQAGCVFAAAFAPDSRVLATAGGPLDPTLKLWNLDDGSLLNTITAGSNGVTAITFSRDGNLLASGADADEQVIRLWNAASGDLVQTLAGHSNGVTALDFSPEGDSLVSGGRGFDNTVKVWSVEGGTLLRTFAGHSGPIEAVAFSPDGRRVASGSSRDNVLQIHELDNGSSRTIGADTNCVFAVAFTPDGAAVASTCHDRIKLWNVATGTLSQTITQETARVVCLAYSPNGNLMIQGREDGTVVVCENVLGALDQPPLRFRSITADTAGTNTLVGEGEPWAHYVIETSTNFVDWEFRGLATAATNILPITDVDTNGSALRVYRALTPP